MTRRTAGGVILAALVLLVPAGCSGGGKKEGRKPAPALVSVAQVSEGEFLDTVDFTGRTAAVETVEVKARATGYLSAVLFTDGEDVEAGQLLYRIDDRTYKAKLAKLKSDIARFEAQLADASSKLSNARRSRIGSAISREEYDTLASAKEAASASLASARDAADEAALELSFTRVYSPIAGRISKTNITKGNLVTADQTLLTTVVSIHPVYAYFDVDERTVLRFQEMIRKNELTSYRDGFFPVYAGTQVEKGYPHTGRIDFVDNRIDPSTGTLRVRGVFPPVSLKKLTWAGLADVPLPGQTMSPGLFVRIRLPVGNTTHKAILISDRAIGSNQGQKYVYVVSADNKVEERTVETGPVRDGMRVIESGLRAGEWIIVSGLQRVRPGAVVETDRVPMPGPEEKKKKD